MSYEFISEKEIFNDDNEPDFSVVAELDFDSVADLARVSNQLGSAPPDFTLSNYATDDKHSPCSADTSPNSSPKQSNMKCSNSSIKDTNSMHIQRRKRVKYVNEPNLSVCIIPKGVYTTLHGYRVQLNMKPNVKTYVKLPTKFSRNCKSYESAIWLYEVMIFISDCPTHLYELLNIGNYDAMLCAKVIPNTNLSKDNMTGTHTALIYLNMFKHQLVLLKQGNILTAQEYMVAMQLLQDMDTQYEYPGLHSVGVTHTVY